MLESPGSIARSLHQFMKFKTSLSGIYSSAWASVSYLGSNFLHCFYLVFCSKKRNKPPVMGLFGFRTHTHILPWVSIKFVLYISISFINEFDKIFINYPCLNPTFCSNLSEVHYIPSDRAKVKTYNVIFMKCLASF